MRLTFHMLEYLMSFSHPLKPTPGEYPDTGFRAIRLWQEGKLQKDIIYMITTEQLKQAQNLSNDVLLVCPSPILITVPCCCLYAQSPTEPASFFNAIQECILNFEDWIANIHHTLVNNLDLNLLFRDSGEYLHMNLALVDDDFRILISSHFAEATDGKNDTPRIKLDTVNSFILEEEYARVKEYRDIFRYPSRHPEIANIYYNIFLHDKYYARLLAQVHSEKKLTGAGQLLLCLGESLTRYYEEQQDANVNGSHEKDFLKTLSMCLQNINIDRTIGERTLGQHGWAANHRYWVICFDFFNKHKVSADYYCTQLTILFSHGYALAIENHIFCICNLSLTSEQTILEQLPLFLRETLCKAGISSPCTDFFRLYYSRLEAESALRLGNLKQENFWYYHFHNYAMYFIIEQATQELPLYNLCHPALHTLLLYDQQNQTELTETLHHYLVNNCNASLTAQNLFIHRTTMFYRLRKIRELTGIKIEDPEIRLHLELSYYMLHKT